MANTITDPAADYEPAESPYQDSTALTVFDSSEWAARLKKAQMLGTYKKTVELEYGTFTVIGVLYPLVDLSETEEVIDATTGEVSIIDKPGRKYHQLKLKLADGKVMMAAGRGASKFWKDDLAGQLGLPEDCGDFPPGVTLTVKIQSETLKGKTSEGANKKWPVFSLV